MKADAPRKNSRDIQVEVRYDASPENVFRWRRIIEILCELERKAMESAHSMMPAGPLKLRALGE